jgi:hypothetical protein
LFLLSACSYKVTWHKRAITENCGSSLKFLDVLQIIVEEGHEVFDLILP